MKQLSPLRVSHTMMLAEDIREITLEPLPGTWLPSFAPGSHIVISPDSQDIQFQNAYSLTSSPMNRQHYKIAVKHQPNSRGGSRYLHTKLKTGDTLFVSTPYNYFPMEQNTGKNLLIAGGIGITPFMSLMPMIEWYSAEFEMHYTFRSAATTAYIDEVDGYLGDRLHRYPSTESKLNIEALLAKQTSGTHIYVCGPESLINETIETAAKLSWPEAMVHFEKFSVATGGTPFSVKLKKSSDQLNVNADESLLDALENAGVPIPNLCRAGVCGECRTKVIDGCVEHHDAFLGEEERRDYIMPCVSRACENKELVLDL